MKTAKQKKSAKAKPAANRMKDLRPKKDAMGGSQKKEDPDSETQRLRSF